MKYDNNAKCSRWVEFFEGDNNRLSMTRLCVFMSIFPASWVVITNGGEGTLGWYISGYVLGYIGGKAADVVKGMPPQITPNPTNITAEGDVNVGKN